LQKAFLAQLRVSLSAPETARVGAVIPIVISIENIGDAPLELYLRGRTIAYDIFVRDESGCAVWQRLQNEVVPGIVQFKILGAGEVLELSHAWNARGNRGELIEPGSYTIQGIVLTDRPEPLQSEIAQIRIVPYG
jgi:Intracellular proteinase inhibitor